MKKIPALLLALLLLLSLAACGSKEDESLYGTWDLYAMDYEGSVLLSDDLMDGDYFITLSKGGNADFRMGAGTASVRWVSEGNVLTISASDGDLTGTVKDGILDLTIDGSAFYFVQQSADPSPLGAIGWDEFFSAVSGETVSAGTESEAVGAEEIALRQQYNGWWYGGLDVGNCSGDYEWLSGYRFDVIMFAELDPDGNGTVEIYEPYGQISEGYEDNRIALLQARGEADKLTCLQGSCFGDDIRPDDWAFVRDSENPDKLGCASSFNSENGSAFSYSLTLMPWGSRWEGEGSYTAGLPHYQDYADRIDAGQADPYGSIGEESPEDVPAEEAGGTESAGRILDLNDRGLFFVTYPESWTYDSGYGKLKNEATGTGILFDPLLDEENFEEWRAVFEEKYSGYDNYSLEETTLNGYRALYCQYEDWIGAYVVIVVDFGDHFGSGSYCGMRFSISGSSIDACSADEVTAIVRSFELS